MKIALIAGKTGQRDRIFPPGILDELRGFGELIVNETESKGDHIKALMSGADIVITSWGTPRMTAEYLDLAPNLKLIVHAAGTVDPIVCEEVWKRGIRVTCSSAAIGRGVAETALGLVISASKNYFQFNNLVHAGGWREAGSERVVDMYDITIGVLGAGMVGRFFINLLTNFELKVIVHDPYLEDSECAKLGDGKISVEKVSLEDLLKRSDILSIHAPSVPETNNLINRESLALMKKDAGLVNTARGSIINEQDLYEHMAKGNLRFACLDVTLPEPPAIDNPLRRLSNVIMLPHIAGVMNNGLGRIGRHVIKELALFNKGEVMANEILEAMMFRIGKS